MGKREDLNHYQVLGVAPTASIQEIRAAYLKGLKFWHPDTASLHNIDRSTAHHKSLSYNLAYAVLRDPAQRSAYDAESQPRESFDPQLYTQEVRKRTLKGIENFLTFILSRANENLSYALSDSQLDSLVKFISTKAKILSQELSVETPLFLEVVAHEALVASAAVLLESRDPFRLELPSILLAASQGIRQQLPAYALLRLSSTRELSLQVADLALLRILAPKSDSVLSLSLEAAKSKSCQCRCECDLKTQEVSVSKVKESQPKEESLVMKTQHAPAPVSFTSIFAPSEKSAQRFTESSYPSLSKLDLLT